MKKKIIIEVDTDTDNGVIIAALRRFVNENFWKTENVKVEVYEG
jgi:hypothetical protein